MAKEIVCAFGTDVDSVAGWLGSYGGGDSPSDIQRGIFASEVGIIRLLNLFKKYKLKTTFFIPGHSIETLPNECRKIVEEGHEIGAHTHENPVAMTPKQEEASS
jgi:peptidoglycan-N-acetylglucosamine deacetylase